MFGQIAPPKKFFLFKMKVFPIFLIYTYFFRGLGNILADMYTSLRSVAMK